MKVDADMLKNLKLEKVHVENRQVVLAATGKRCKRGAAHDAETDDCDIERGHQEIAAIHFRPFRDYANRNCSSLSPG